MRTILYLIPSFQGNKLTGQIPPEVCALNVNWRFYGDAKTQGTSVAQIPPPKSCDRIACTPDTYSMTGLGPCQPCRKGLYTPYLGTEGRCMRHDQKLIVSQFLSEATSLANTTKEGGGGGTPIFPFTTDDQLCTYPGVSCDDNLAVVAIDWSDQHLQGTIPSSLGYLQHLERLDLSNNELTGLVPPELQFAPLISLDITDNHLTGIIPDVVCESIIAGKSLNGMNVDDTCNQIACPVSTFNPESGRAPCQPCLNAQYLGSKSCSLLSQVLNTDNWSQRTIYGIAAVIAISVWACIMGIWCCCMSARQKKKQNNHKYPRRQEPPMTERNANSWKTQTTVLDSFRDPVEVCEELRHITNNRTTSLASHDANLSDESRFRRQQQLLQQHSKSKSSKAKLHTSRNLIAPNEDYDDHL